MSDQKCSLPASASALAPMQLERSHVASPRPRSPFGRFGALSRAARSAPAPSPSDDVLTPDELESLVTAVYAALDALAMRVGFDIEEPEASDASDGDDA